MALSDQLFGEMEALEDKRTSIKDILTIMFQKKGIEQHTILSNENINAIIKMRTANKYLKGRYGFEIDLYNTLIDEKRLNVISLNGRGRDDIIETVKAMQDNHIQFEEKRGLI